MLEAVLTLCLAGAPETCRDALLPAQDCAQAVAPALPPGVVAAGAPRCAAPGPALHFAEVAPGLWAHRGAVAAPGPENAGDVSNIGFVIGSSSVAVIDSGGSRAVGEAAWRALRAITDLPVSHVILTHMHPDHVYGATVFAEAGAKVAAHAGLPRALADRDASYRAGFGAAVGAGFIGAGTPRVDIAITVATEIDLGGRILRLTPHPIAHSIADLTVVDAQTNTLFAGDLVFDAHAPALDGSLPGWLAALRRIEALAPDAVVPGHGGPVMEWKAAAAPMRRYLNALARDIRAALAQGAPLSRAVDGAAESERGAWRLFEEFNPRNATAAYVELEWE